MLLGNADRMPCADLGWRGNANNLLYGAAGNWMQHLSTTPWAQEAGLKHPAAEVLSSALPLPPVAAHLAAPEAPLASAPGHMIISFLCPCVSQLPRLTSQ